MSTNDDLAISYRVGSFLTSEWGENVVKPTTHKESLKGEKESTQEKLEPGLPSDYFPLTAASFCLRILYE